MPPRAQRAAQLGPVEDSAAWRNLKELSECELAAPLTPRVRRLLAAVIFSTQASNPEVQRAWSSAWAQPKLRIGLFVVLSTCTRRLVQLSLLPDADDDETYAALYPCFLGLGNVFRDVVRGVQGFQVAADAISEAIRLAVDSQLPAALARLAAAAAQAETRQAQRRVALLRAARSVRALRAADAGGASASSFLLVGGSCIELLTAFLVTAADISESGRDFSALERALEDSGALGAAARAVISLAAAGAEVDAAKLAAAAAVGAVGGSAAGGRAPAAAGGRGDAREDALAARNIAAKHVLRVCKCVHIMWELYARVTNPNAEAAAAAAAAAAGPAAVAAAAAAAARQAAKLQWLERVLSHPAVQHLLLQHLLAQVVAADGGSVYGPTLTPRLPALMVPLLYTTCHTLGYIDAAAGGGATRSTGAPGELAMLLLSDATNAALDMWALASLQDAAGTAAGAAEHDGGSGSSSGSGQGFAHQPGIAAFEPRPDWPPGAPWKQAYGAVVLGRAASGGRSGRLRRPPVPMAALEALRCGCLVAATKALVLAFSNRKLQAQQRQQQRQQQQGTAEAEAGVSGGAAPAHEADLQGDVRALRRPLARVAHACVDTAAATGADLGHSGMDGKGPNEEVYHEAVAAVGIVEHLMSPCGGPRIPPLPAGHNELLTLLPAPLPSQAAALSSGYLPALERLLRALHRTRGSERQRGHRLLGGFGLFASHVRSFVPTWAAAFAYGQPQEVASLVATCASVMRLLVLSVDVLRPPGTSVTLRTAATYTVAVQVHNDTPGEMAMRRGLLHGPNMLRGLLDWLADSTAGESAAALATAAGLAPGECWWQRQWSRRLALQPPAGGPGGSSAGGSDSCGSTAVGWGLPGPVLQALALSSFTLRRWLLSMSRAAQHLCTQAHGVALVAADFLPGDTLSKAMYAIPSDPGAALDDDCGHAGTHGRAAAGVARMTFQAAAPLMHAFALCEEHAAAARARAGNNSSGGAAAAAAGGAESGEAKAVAAEAAAAAAAWKQLLLECLPPCIMAAAQLVAVGPATHISRADLCWLVQALLQLLATWPEEASRRLGPLSMPTLPPVHVATALHAQVGMRLAASGRVEEVRVLKEALRVAQAVQERDGGLAPGEREALQAGCTATASWCEVGERAPLEPDWARRVGALLPPPGLAAELLGLGAGVGSALDGCSNEECVAMPGDSAAGAPARRCGGRCGGAVSYCCETCQAAHWKAAHKSACGKK
ncbi:hypothetical protein HXX76_010269 [Chlamydomonas incerta]|uniref:MYND-type domain-containing protein n=1 Tax=Chlamydomonas incerta TaxID=51695 RepID=A0A835T0G0_CHLIN|nr:hypothetical protein HXX76_010269 [Chlamydomonas incerta]|eukprot:KAG2430170.1 hypothetical protein HXX76_010269 [Chlamydomonas incerta]